MQKLFYNHSGFAHFFVVSIFVLVVSVVGFTAWQVKNQQRQNSNASTNVDQQAQDNQKVENKVFSFSAAGDFSSTSAADLVLKKISKSSTDFTLALGDLGYAGNGTEAEWCKYVTDRVGTSHAFELIAGNHDDGTKDGDILQYRKCLPNKLKNIYGDYGIEYYFDYNNLARFILISPNISNVGFDYSIGSEHYNWLSKTIDDARKSGLKWIILGMHKNCITIGVKTCEIGEDLLNLAVSKKIDLVLQGHEHNYSRSKQLALSSDCPRIASKSFNKSCIVSHGKIFEKNAGTIIVISGAGGVELRDINLEDAEIGYYDTWNGNNVGNSHGFSRFTLSDNKLDAEFVAVNGTYKDSFSVASE